MNFYLRYFVIVLLLMRSYSVFREGERWMEVLFIEIGNVCVFVVNLELRFGFFIIR